MSFPFLPGVYEWVTFQMKPGGPASWGQSFQAAINAHINTGYSKLIGVFHTEYGLLNTGTAQFVIHFGMGRGEGSGASPCPGSGLAGLMKMSLWITKVL